MSKADCIREQIQDLMNSNSLREDIPALAARKCKTSKAYAEKIFAEEFAGLPAPRHAIVIDRTDTWCGDCKIGISTREAKTCPNCGVTFTHVTTTCAPVWMPSVVQAIRQDLEYAPCLEVIL